MTEQQVLLRMPLLEKPVRWFGQTQDQTERLRLTPALVLRECVTMWDEREVQMGILLSCEPLEGDNREPFERFNGHAALLDPITWWRALQVLEALPVLEEIDFSIHLFFGSLRREPPHPARKALCDLIGQDCMWEILARPIPQEVLNILIRLADEGRDVADALRQASDEIAAGTLRWSRQLRAAGIKHPDYWCARQQAKETIVERYRTWLFSYATQMGYTYGPTTRENAFIMNCIEWELTHCVERGIERDYGRAVTCVLGIFHTERLHHDALQALANEFPQRYPNLPMPAWLRDLPDPASLLHQTITWLFEQLPSPTIDLPQGQSQTREAVQELIAWLDRRYEHLPVVEPLVPEPEDE